MISSNNHDLSLFYILLAFLLTNFVHEHINEFFFSFKFLNLQNYADIFVCFPFSYFLYNERIKTNEIQYPFCCHSK